MNVSIHLLKKTHKFQINQQKHTNNVKTITNHIEIILQKV